MRSIVTKLTILGATLFAQNSLAQAPSNLDNPNALKSFYSSLSGLSEEQTKSPVHIIMIGDSHAASDLISASLRYELQLKFGNSGRGLIQAGNPYEGFAPIGLVIKSPKKWTNAISFPKSKADDGPFGLGGFRARVSETPEIYSIDVASGNEFDRISICGNILEENTKLDFEVLNSRGKINFDNTNGEINCLVARLPESASQLKIKSTIKQKPIGLSTIGLWQDRPGIILSSFGVVGSQLYDLARRNMASVASEFAALPPNLIILEFGTNEGFDPNFDMQKYKYELKFQISEFQRIAPNASILIIGAPDANKKAIGAFGDDCAILNKEAAAKFPNISYLDTKASYYSPPNLKQVRQAQAEIAKEIGAAYWDWFNFMGGECSANMLALKSEKEVLGDRVHFSKIGAQKVGLAIANDIITGFESFEKILQ